MSDTLDTLVLHFRDGRMKASVAEISRVTTRYFGLIRSGAMDDETKRLDELQQTYKAAVEQWIELIKHEVALASGSHSIEEIDEWEKAFFEQDEMRVKVEDAKSDYEDALREKFFGF